MADLRAAVPVLAHVSRTDSTLLRDSAMPSRPSHSAVYSHVLREHATRVGNIFAQSHKSFG
jgi:hypothetical protein